MTQKLDKWKQGLARTSKSGFGRIANLLGMSAINPAMWEDLETLLIQADLGMETTLEVIETLQERARHEGWTKSLELQSALREDLASRLEQTNNIIFDDEAMTVILIVGVNGSGKTTSVVKLGKHFQKQGKSVLFAAADTFRAAAIEQLQMGGERLKIRVVAGKSEGDASAVAYDAIQSAIAQGENLLLVDTAGRLHTRFNLMEELKKMNRVVAKALPGAPHAVWLVMDATTGQNGIQQAKAFKEAVGVSGIILAKLDTSGRGGMVFAIQSQLGLPILFAGLGEGEDDLEPFNRDEFIDGVLAEFG